MSGDTTAASGSDARDDGSSTGGSSTGVSHGRGLLGDRFTRHGTSTLVLFTALLLAVTGGSIAGAILSEWTEPCAAVAVVGFLLWIFVLSFFRNPRRTIPQGPDVVVAPADGKVLGVDAVEDEEYIGGAATRISIFLSVFNVHVNRAPVAGVVEHLDYRRGTFRSATSRKARETNECQALGLRMEDGTPVLVRQIAGLIARRIVCPISEGARLTRGFDYGMIRFGSQTEVSVPDRGEASGATARKFVPRVAPGDTIQGGETIIGVWE